MSFLLVWIKGVPFGVVPGCVGVEFLTRPTVNVERAELAGPGGDPGGGPDGGPGGGPGGASKGDSGWASGRGPPSRWLPAGGGDGDECEQDEYGGGDQECVETHGGGLFGFRYASGELE